MTMRAILLTPNNFETITSDHDVHINAEHLRKLYFAYQALDQEMYFIPLYVTITDVDTRDWICIDSEYLKESFTYDKDKIHDQFVEIIRG